MRSILWHRLYKGLTSPWSIGLSIFGVGYGVYQIIDMSQSGQKYDLKADLSGKTYIVTGASSGIGKQITEELAKRSARVIMACRDREKCVKVRRDIVLKTHNKQIYCRHCDLADFESIRNFVSKVSYGKFELDRIDGVLHNAGTMEPSRKVNKDGIELSLATNCLGSFLMTGLLLDKLLAQSIPVRIVFVNTNTITHNCDLHFDNLNFEGLKKWNGYEIYKETKLAAAMFAKELSDRVKDKNITVLVADPGRTRTNLTAKSDAQIFFLSRWLLKPVSFFMGQRRVNKAVRPILYALADEEMEEQTGLFIDRENNIQSWSENVLDSSARKRLWSTCVKWTRLDEQLKTLRHELAEAKKVPLDDTSKDAAESAGKSQRSWRTLWLW